MDAAEIGGQIGGEVGEFFGPGGDHHGGAADPFPGHDAVADTEFGSELRNNFV